MQHFHQTLVITVDPVTIRCIKHRLDTTIGAESVPTPYQGWPPPYHQPPDPQPVIIAPAGETEAVRQFIPSHVLISHANGRLPPTIGGQGDRVAEEKTTSAPEEEQESTGDEVRTNSKIMITTLSGKRGPCQMCVRWS